VNLRTAIERILLVNIPKVLKPIEDDTIRVRQFFDNFRAGINGETGIVASYDQLKEAK
jgi:hypothetical protein